MHLPSWPYFCPGALKLALIEEEKEVTAREMVLARNALYFPDGSPTSCVILVIELSSIYEHLRIIKRLTDDYVKDTFTVTFR